MGERSDKFVERGCPLEFNLVKTCVWSMDPISASGGLYALILE